MRTLLFIATLLWAPSAHAADAAVVDTRSDATWPMPAYAALVTNDAGIVSPEAVAYVVYGDPAASPSQTAGLMRAAHSVKLLAAAFIGFALFVWGIIELVKRRWPDALSESQIDLLTMVAGTLYSGAWTLSGSDWGEALLMFVAGPGAIIVARLNRLRRHAAAPDAPARREADPAYVRRESATPPYRPVPPPVPPEQRDD